MILGSIGRSIWRSGDLVSCDFGIGALHGTKPPHEFHQRAGPVVAVSATLPGVLAETRPNRFRHGRCSNGGHAAPRSRRTDRPIRVSGVHSQRDHQSTAGREAAGGSVAGLCHLGRGKLSRIRPRPLAGRIHRQARRGGRGSGRSSVLAGISLAGRVGRPGSRRGVVERSPGVASDLRSVVPHSPQQSPWEAEAAPRQSPNHPIPRSLDHQITRSPDRQIFT